MFKIGEFSKLTKVSVRMLRYYDEVGLLKPALADPLTGYRLYATEQIPQLQRIVLLRDMAFNVVEIAEALKQWQSSTVLELLAAKKEALQQNILRERRQIQKIETALQDFQNQSIDVHYNIVLKAIPSFWVVSLREWIPDYFSEGLLWERLYAFIQSESVALVPGDHNVAMYHNEAHLDEGVEVEVGVGVKRPGVSRKGFVYRQTEAVETMACIMVYGPYRNIGPAYQAFAYWLEAHQQYEMAGPSRQICHIGVYNEEDAEKYLTEIQVPVKIRDVFLLDSDMV